MVMPWDEGGGHCGAASLDLCGNTGTTFSADVTESSLCWHGHTASTDFEGWDEVDPEVWHCPRKFGS